MSKEEQDLILMKVIRDNKEAQARLVALQTKAAELGEQFEMLGRLLKEDAGAISTGAPALAGRTRHSLQRSKFDINDVVRTIEQINQTEIDLSNYHNKLQAAGLI